MAMYIGEIIKNVVGEINDKYFLPHIQRALIWKEPQITKLFDSIMRDYPISTFLFWRVKENKGEITKLKFIENFEKGKPNEENKNIDRTEYWLVLDGQQRLQSFLISLKGDYNKKELFFNALSKKPIQEDETDEDEETEDTEVIYEFKFKKNNESDFLVKEKINDTEVEVEKLWVKVKDFGLLGYNKGEKEDEDQIYSFIDQLKKKYGKLDYDKIVIMERNIKKLHDVLTKKEIIFYYLESEPDYDKVLDIFIRTNSGGTKLSKSDLLFSMIKLNWKQVNALDEFKSLLKSINQGGKFNFDTDFILKTSLMLTDCEVQYKVENIKKNMSTIEEKWGSIKINIKCVIDLLEDIGISDKKLLPSKNAIIPIIYFSSKNSIRTFRSDNQDILKNKAFIKKWIFNSLLNNIFSGNSDKILKICRYVLKEKDIFSANEINLQIIKESNRSTETNIEKLKVTQYGDKEVHFILGILQPNINFNPSSESNKPHIDHIFPENLLEGKYKGELIDDIANLELLTATENESKNKKPFEEWIKTQSDDFLDEHIIPKNPKLWKIENYKQFVEERRQLIFDRLKKNLN